MGGTGTGPHGPAMAFRLTPVPPGGQGFFGSTDTSGLTQRDGYPAPCHYLGEHLSRVGVHANATRSTPRNKPLGLVTLDGSLRH